MQSKVKQQGVSQRWPVSQRLSFFNSVLFRHLKNISDKKEASFVLRCFPARKKDEPTSSGRGSAHVITRGPTGAGYLTARPRPPLGPAHREGGPPGRSPDRGLGSGENFRRGVQRGGPWAVSEVTQRRTSIL